MALNGPIAVVGSGPAGVAAARPLIEAGLPVTIIDAGSESMPPPPPDRPTLAELRRDAPRSWQYLVGEDLRGLRDMSAVSPKFRLAADPDFLDRFTAFNRIRAANFVPIGCLAPGGLSNVWGAITFAYDDADMAGWPIGASDLAASYRRVSERIGVSGPLSDDLDRGGPPPLRLQAALPLSPLGMRLLMAYGRKRDRLKIRLGRTRLAVLSADHGGRKACSLDNACFLGCAQGSIYSAAQELPDLLERRNVEFLASAAVERLRRNGDGWTLDLRDRQSGAGRSLAAAKVILAAGALASARLALEAAGRSDSVALENSPAIAFALLFPAALGAALPGSGFGMAQIGFSLPLGDTPGNEMLGLLYPADSLSSTEFLQRMPTTRPGGIALLRDLVPGLFIGLAYLPGSYSQNRVRLVAGADGKPWLDIEGGRKWEFAATLRSALGVLRRDFLRLGGFLLPGSVQIYQPGAEAHYAGPLAMGRLSDRLGEIAGAPGLHAVDGAALPGMPARNPTLTIMANADRIGTALAARWSQTER